MPRSSEVGLADGVWARASHNHSVGERAFVALLNLWILLGLGVSAWGAYVSQGWMPGWWMLAAALIPFAGVFISLGSSNPVVSLFGYALITVPFGFLLGPVVAMYTAASVVKIMIATAAVSGTLGLVGMILPDLLKGWGSFLFTALTALVICQFFGLFAAMAGIPVEGVFHWLDWIGVFLFSAYITFDYGRAMRVERTVDNSIDCAVAIYLDIFNLFIRLLSLFGVKKD